MDMGKTPNGVVLRPTNNERILNEYTKASDEDIDNRWKDYQLLYVFIAVMVPVGKRLQTGDIDGFVSLSDDSDIVWLNGTDVSDLLSEKGNSEASNTVRSIRDDIMNQLDTLATKKKKQELQHWQVLDQAKEIGIAIRQYNSTLYGKVGDLYAQSGDSSNR